MGTKSDVNGFWKFIEIFIIVLIAFAVPCQLWIWFGTKNFFIICSSLFIGAIVIFIRKLDDRKMMALKNLVINHIFHILIFISLVLLSFAVWNHGRYQQTGGAYILDTHTGAISTFADAPRIGR